MRDRITELEAQLLAEQEKVAWCPVHAPTAEEPITCCPCCEAVREMEKVQTLVDALKEVNALARGNMTGCGTCSHVIDATIKVL